MLEQRTGHDLTRTVKANTSLACERGGGSLWMHHLRRERLHRDAPCPL